MEHSLSVCYLSFHLNTSELSEPGYKLDSIPVKAAKDYIGMKTDVSFILSNRQSAGYWNSLGLSLLMINSVWTFKEWKRHLILKVCQALLTVQVELCML